ncbi:MAG: transcriptional repressor LexA [Pseudomarimonas sp.]
MTDDLTTRQQAVLSFVRERIAADGLPPTWAEIARAFGFRQTRAAQKHLQALAAKGHLILLPGKARGIQLVDADDAHTGSQISARISSKRADGMQVPLLGRVAAGMPIDADAGVQRWITIDPTLYRQRPDCLLRVVGDSMRDDGILDGDLLVVLRTNTARDGETVVARVEGELTVKRLHLSVDQLHLLPRNPDYAAIVIDHNVVDFAIEGVYLGVLRSV